MTIETVTTHETADRMGRNPFKARPIPTLVPETDAKAETSGATADTTAKASAKTGSGLIERALALPLRGVILGIKSWMIVRYLVKGRQ